MIDRGGVGIAWESYGDGAPDLLLLPTWSIVTSRLWKAQVPYLARRHRVVTFDGRGNGGSGRPTGAEAYSTEVFAADALAVMDAASLDRGVVVATSCGALWATILAADHPERVTGVVYISPAVRLAPGHPEREVHPFDEPLDSTEGWAKYNSFYWAENYQDFLDFFMTRCFNEPHSTKPIEDGVGWALQTDPTQPGVDHPRHRRATERAVRGDMPTDYLPHARHPRRPGPRPAPAQGAALAAATRGELVVLEGSGHLPMARDPVRINLLLREFIAALSQRDTDER